MLHRIQIRALGWSWKRSHGFTLKVGGYCPWMMCMVLSSKNTGLAASGWLSKWRMTTVCKTSLMYWLPVRFRRMLSKSTCNPERYNPISLLSLPCKGQLAGYSLGNTPYFSVSKLSFVHQLHEAETGFCLTNGSYARSSNSNHITLNTMPNVFVDVNLIIWDV